MKDYGLEVPLIGGDGIVDKNYIDIAGTSAENSYGTVAAPNDYSTNKTREFMDDYDKRFEEPRGKYSIAGYEAAKIAINAIDRADKPDREAVCKALRDTRDYLGISGKISFDENGDTTNKIISIYRAEGNPAQWVFKEQRSYNTPTTTPTLYLP